MKPILYSILALAMPSSIMTGRHNFHDKSSTDKQFDCIRRKMNLYNNQNLLRRRKPNDNINDNDSYTYVSLSLFFCKMTLAFRRILSIFLNYSIQFPVDNCQIGERKDKCGDLFEMTPCNLACT